MNAFNKEPRAVDEQRTAKGGRTRAKILEHALVLFREQGFEATTIRQVAEAAGVSVGNTYYYFASKEHLVHGFHASSAVAFEERCRELFAREPNLGRRLSGVLRTRVVLAEPYHRLAPILFEPATEKGSPFHPASPEARAMRAASVATMRVVVEGSQARIHADLRPHLPALLALYESALLRFWARDESAHQVRTARLIEHGSALGTRLLTLAGMPFMGALRSATVDLVQDLHTPPPPAP